MPSVDAGAFQKIVAAVFSLLVYCATIPVGPSYEDGAAVSSAGSSVGSAVGSSLATGVGDVLSSTMVPLPASSSPLCEAKINATASTPTRMKKNGPDPFFFAGVPALATGAGDFAVDDADENVEPEVDDVGIDEGETTPRVGTSGMVTPAATADFFARDALFLTGRFAVFLTLFLTAFLTGAFFTAFLTADFLAVDLLATVFFPTVFLAAAFFAVRLAGAFFAAFLTGRFAATDLTPYSAITYVPLLFCTLSSFNPALNLRES
jgi:hypothetical protein